MFLPTPWWTVYACTPLYVCMEAGEVAATRADVSESQCIEAHPPGGEGTGGGFRPPLPGPAGALILRTSTSTQYR